MSRRAAIALALAPALLAGCKVYDSGKVKLRVEIVGSPHVVSTLDIKVAAPSSVGAVGLTVDGVTVIDRNGSDGWPANEVTSVFVEGYSKGVHRLRVVAPEMPDVVGSEEVEFYREDPIALGWSPFPGTVTFAQGQVFRATFSEPLDAASRLAVQSSTRVRNWRDTVVPSAVTDLGDGRRFEILVPDADLFEFLGVQLPLATGESRIATLPALVWWMNTPLTISLSSDVSGPRVTSPTGVVNFTVTVGGSGRLEGPVLVSASNRTWSGSWTLNGPPYGFSWDSSSAPEGYYGFWVSAAVRDQSPYYCSSPCSSRISFWVERTPAMLSYCYPYQFPDSVSPLSAHDVVNCTFSKPLDPLSLDQVHFVDAGGSAIPSATALLPSAQTIRVERLSGAGIPGAGSLLLAGLRDGEGGLDVASVAVPVEWPVWDPWVDFSSSRYALWPASLACGTSPAGGARIAVAHATDFLNVLNVSTLVPSLGSPWTPGAYDGLPSWQIRPDAPGLIVDVGSNVILAWAASASSVSQVHSLVLPAQTRSVVGGTSASGACALALDPVTSQALVAFRDGGAIVVKRLVSGSWSQEGGLPRSGGAPGSPALAATSAGAPIVAWVEAGAVEVRRVGASDWTLVGPPLSGPGGAAVANVSLGVLPGGDPVLAYETVVGGVPSVLVSRWDGSAWVQMGGVLNQDPARGAHAPSLALDSAGMAWVALADDDPAGRTVRLRAFDGASWNVAGGQPLPRSPCSTACVPRVAICPGDAPVVIPGELSGDIWVHRLNKW